MIHIEDTELEISTLVCSDDFERRLGEKHVADLAESIRDIGLINKPWVRASDMKVICGEDRIAAHCLLNRDFVEARVVECTDDEFEKVRLAENRYRRSPEQVRELVEAIEQRIEAESLGVEVTDTMTFANGSSIEFVGDADEPYQSSGFDPYTPDKRGPGRPKTTRGAAVEEAARQLGTTPNAVRKKLERATPKEKEGPPFETWGREPSEKIVKDARRAYEALTNAYSKITSAMAIITDMQMANIVTDDFGLRTWDELKLIADSLKVLRPAALCPYCKGQKLLIRKCQQCRVLGFVTAAKANNAPAELKERPSDVELGF